MLGVFKIFLFEAVIFLKTELSSHAHDSVEFLPISCLVYFLYFPL